MEGKIKIYVKGNLKRGKNIIKVKGGYIYLKEERKEKRKWGEKGESYEKGQRKKGRGGTDGEYGESVQGIPAFDIAG